MPVSRLIRETPALARVLTLLEDDGHAAHLVGGAVRNVLMDIPVGDLDVATSAHPDVVARIFEAAGAEVHPTGIDHGTLTVVVDEIPFEITTWRKDVATDGRRATIAFATHMKEDAQRRDFTINALYADVRGEIFDPTGFGLEDIAERRLAFVGTPSDRIREDHLRILRFYRFAATHGITINASSEDAQACRVLGPMVQDLPGERMGQEMRKLMGADNPASALAQMQEDEVLFYILISPKSPRRIAAVLSALRAAEYEMGLSPDPIRRIATLTNSAPSEALRLSRAETRRFRALASAARGRAGPAELGYRLGAQDARSALAIRVAICPHTNTSAEAIAAIDKGAVSRFPVSGGDLKDHISGPALGAALKDMEAQWIASGFTLDREALLERHAIPA